MVKEQVASVVHKVKSRIDQAKSEDPDKTPWVKQVAMLTGVLAAMSGFLEVRSTTITNDAIYSSNQAILAQAESSDDWNEYQANSIKARIVETALEATSNLTAAKRKDLTDEDTELRGQQPALKTVAEKKAQERDDDLKNGRGWLSERDLLGYAGLMAQIGIALASVAALVRWRLPFMVGICTGLGGGVIAAYALAMQYGLLG